MSNTKPTVPAWVPRLAIAAGVLLVLAWVVSYALRPVALVAAAIRMPAVSIVPGTVEVKAEFTIELKSDVTGRVILSKLDIGKPVAKGDTLIQIDTGDIDLEIERYKNEITAAKRKFELGSTRRADVLNKRDTLANLERQVKVGTYPQAEYDKEKRLLQQLEQLTELDEVNLKLALETNENMLRTKQREKEKMTIKAPSDGVVTAVTTRVGDLIGSNSPIATIISIGRTIEAKISEENFAAIKLGQTASVRFLTFGADQYDAKISKILPAADPTTQRYTVFLELTKPLPEGRVLLPGLTGEVSIIISERPNAINIPHRALVGDYVYVVAGGKVEQRKITKGFDSMNYVEILSGLAEGEMVIVEQLDRFREGNRVRTQVLPK
jgi:RND family efflux transporter MFP subunit